MSKKLTKGEIATLLGIQKSQIRFYEKKGLLKVNQGENGYSEYGYEELDSLEMILLLKKLGMSIKEINETLNETTFDYEYYLNKAYDNIQSEIKVLQTNKREIERKLKAYYDFGDGYKIETIEERHLYIIEDYDIPKMDIRDVFNITREYNVDYLNYDYELVELSGSTQTYGFFYHDEEPKVATKKITIPKGIYFTYEFSFRKEDELGKYDEEVKKAIESSSYNIVGPRILIDHLYSKLFHKDIWSFSIQYLVEES